MFFADRTMKGSHLLILHHVPRNLNHSLIPPLKLPRKLIQRKPQMLILHLFPFTQSKRVRRPRRILNLPPVNPALRQLRDLRLRDTLGGRTHLRDEGGPHLFFRLLCEFAEVERDVDTREECFIERLMRLVVRMPR